MADLAVTPSFRGGDGQKLRTVRNIGATGPSKQISTAHTTRILTFHSTNKQSTDASPRARATNRLPTRQRTKNHLAKCGAANDPTTSITWFSNVQLPHTQLSPPPEVSVLALAPRRVPAPPPPLPLPPPPPPRTAIGLVLALPFVFLGGPALKSAAYPEPGVGASRPRVALSGWRKRPVIGGKFHA